jgi:hypothetical protein
MAAALLLLMGSPQLAEAHGHFLDVYLRVQPADDFCGARQCNISYALSILSTAQNQFDLQSMMLQDGSMHRNERLFFEDNTVVRLTHELRSTRGKIYLGLKLFDVPEDMQDYVIVEVTDVIHGGRRTKTEFSSETVNIGVHVYRRSEAIIAAPTHRDADNSVLIVEDEPQFDSNERANESSRHYHTHSRNAVPMSSILPSSTSRQQQEENGCACETGECGCCEHMVVRKIHLNDSVCVNVTYVSEDIGLRLTLSVDGYNYISKEISVRNPPPVCFSVPHLRDYASLCIKLYNVDAGRDHFSACSEIEAHLYHVTIARQKIGCFRIPL